MKANLIQLLCMSNIFKGFINLTSCLKPMLDIMEKRCMTLVPTLICSKFMRPNVGTLIEISKIFNSDLIDFQIKQDRHKYFGYF